MPVLKGEERDTDIWGDLAEQIAEELFPQNRENLKEDIEKIIQKFVKERVTLCFFTCKGVKK
jgi:hypothetical protein